MEQYKDGPHHVWDSIGDRIDMATIRANHRALFDVYLEDRRNHETMLCMNQKCMWRTYLEQDMV